MTTKRWSTQWKVEYDTKMLGHGGKTQASTLIPVKFKWTCI